VADRGGLTALIRSGYERLQAGGVAEIADLLDPAFEVQTAPDLPEAGTYRGRGGFERLIETLTEPFEDVRIEPEMVIELSKQLLIVPVHIVGNARLSGIPLDTRVVHVWTMRSDKALRLRVFVSQAEVMEAVMRDAYDAYNAGNFDSIRALLDPEVALYEESELPDATVRHGPDGVAQYFQEGIERWQTFELEMDQVIVPADHVVVVTGVMRGRGSLSGAEVESPFGHVYELQNWRVKRITFYFDPDRALEAARS
jgi:ketosteroid isomerase-like protein